MRDDVQTLADAVRARHEPGVAAILAYGSCLRDNTSEGLIDLYVLTRDYKSVSRNVFSRWLCRLVPPNVYYAETQGLRSKYAVLPLSRFAKLARAQNPYIWARFGQPCRVVYAADAAAVERALAQCAETMWAQAAALSHTGDTALLALTRLFAATYATELRPESSARASVIVNADAAFYEASAAKHLGAGWRSANTTQPNWRTRRIIGKALSVARLVKAGFTFQGGADYMAWKIQRHSGVEVKITDWQRKHPVLGALSLLPQLLKKGAVR
ncbi:MAG: hypothetical protein NWR47_00220 [Aestuariivirgaceae bacterium]|nr:hypothetical protein [Aestuariivirgaceae bacterium]